MTATERNTGSTGGEITTESSENTSISTDVRVGEGVSGDDAGASQVRTSRLWLEALAGCLKGQVWEVGPAGATVGRASDNNLSLADKEMSRRHSKVRSCPVSRGVEKKLCVSGSGNVQYFSDRCRGPMCFSHTVAAISVPVNAFRF